MDGLGTQYLFVTITDTNTLMKRVVAHSPLWKKFFSAEASALSEKLGPTLMTSHHIGSTAIPSLPAKPIIDILLEVTSVSLLDKKSSTLESRGYDLRGEYGIEGRRYFKKQPVGGVPGFHVHAYEAPSSTPSGLSQLPQAEA